MAPARIAAKAPPPTATLPAPLAGDELLLAAALETVPVEERVLVALEDVAVEEVLVE